MNKQNLTQNIITKKIKITRNNKSLNEKDLRNAVLYLEDIVQMLEKRVKDMKHCKREF